MDAHQKKFLMDEIFSLTLMGTVGRANVYTSGLSEGERKALQSALRKQLEQFAHEYEEVVQEEAHIQNILKLSKYLTEAHANILQGGRLRIGTAQKALNLYLKYLWCLGKVPVPPHCPFDYQIIAKLPAYTGPNWTMLDSVKDYRALVTVAKAKAHGISLAVWELHTYNHARPVPRGEPRVVTPKNVKSAEKWLRELFSVKGAEYNLEQLKTLTGKSGVNLKTKLSDLRNPRYCGRGGVLETESVNRGGKLYYRRAKKS